MLLRSVSVVVMLCAVVTIGRIVDPSQPGIEASGEMSDHGAMSSNRTKSLSCVVQPEDVEAVLGSRVTSIKVDRRPDDMTWPGLAWVYCLFRTESGLQLGAYTATDFSLAAMPERSRGMERRRIGSLDADVFMRKARRPGLAAPEIQELIVVRGSYVVRMYQGVGVSGIAKDYADIEAFVTTVAERLPNPPQLPADSPQLPVSVIR